MFTSVTPEEVSEGTEERAHDAAPDVVVDAAVRCLLMSQDDYGELRDAAKKFLISEFTLWTANIEDDAEEPADS